MIILASGSPQRKKLLQKMRLPFRAVPSGVSEEIKQVLSPPKTVQKIALKKALDVSRKYPHRWVVGCDTLVFLKNGKKIGKPNNKKEADRIIRSYSGSECEVLSGVAFVKKDENRNFTEFETTRLKFRKITPAERKAYLKTGEWKNRSGAMTLEGKGGAFVTQIIGDYWNVIGLPTLLLKKMWKRGPGAGKAEV